MIKIGDMVECEPTVKVQGGPRRAKVVYIHPLGRFYEVEFSCRGGATFRETQEFTPEQKEEAYQLGIFPRPVEEILYDPREKRKQQQAQEWRLKHRPVEDPDYDDDEDDISTIMAMA